jgi:hypothetical protein
MFDELIEKVIQTRRRFMLRARLEPRRRCAFRGREWR